MSIRVGLAGVYAIINLNNGAAYVGSTTNFEKRWYEHRWALLNKRHGNPYLQAAWDKYGEGAFKFAIVEVVNGTTNDLVAREQFWIDFFAEHGRIYNVVWQASAPTSAHLFSEEAKRQLAKTVSQAWQDGKYDHVHNEEWGRKSSLGLKAAHARGCYRNAHTEESDHKRSESMKAAWARGVFDTPEWRRKVVLGCSKPYPAFIHTATGKIIPAGFNLKQMCREKELSQGLMWKVQHGWAAHHKGWRVVAEAL